jgi:hypothetical protein
MRITKFLVFLIIFSINIISCSISKNSQENTGIYIKNAEVDSIEGNFKILAIDSVNNCYLYTISRQDENDKFTLKVISTKNYSDTTNSSLPSKNSLIRKNDLLFLELSRLTTNSKNSNCLLNDINLRGDESSISLDDLIIFESKMIQGKYYIK